MSIRRNGQWAIMVGVVLVALTLDTYLTSPQTHAQGITIPNTFVNGTIADADQVNANFAALSANAVNRNGGSLAGTLNLNGQTLSGSATFSGAITFSTPPAGINAVPGGNTMAMYAISGTCPSGWTEVAAARGYYIVGLPAGGTNAGISGTPLTNLESRPVGQHTHVLTMNAHGHTITDPGHSHLMGSSSNTGGLEPTVDPNGTNPANAAPSTSTSTTGITVNSTTSTGTIANAGSVAGTNAPYIQYPLCSKN